MRIGHKLTIGFVSIALLIGPVGYLAINTSQKALQKSIGGSSASLADKILNEIDRTIYTRIEEFQIYSKDVMAREIVKNSNQEFEKLDDIQNYINKKDTEWTSAPKEEVTVFMQELMNNKLSKELKGKIEFHEEKYGHKAFSEVFATNKYGANVGQTGKTTDYYQADEEWWQVAKKDGLYVADVGYDESADVYSTNIGIRIDDEDGNFIGVMKVVLNIEEVINVIKEAEPNVEYDTAEFKLLTKDGKTIYSTEDFEFLEDVSDKLVSHFQQEEEHEHTSYIIGEGDLPDEGKELFAHAHSEGYKDFKGLGWILVVEHETEEIFAPVDKLRNIILIISLSATVLAVLLGFLISKSISKRVTKLRDAAVGISKGNLNIKIETASNDEIGELAASFNDMATKLKESYSGLEEKVQQRTRELEEQIAQRSLAQNKLAKSAKETNCLYELSKLVEKPELSVEQIFQKAVELIRSAYRYPDKTCVRITFEGIHYKTDNFEKSELSQHASIKLRREKAGDIEVYYLGERPKNGQSVFLKEERNLLDAVAGHLGRTAERKQAAEKLRLFRNLLDRSNDCIFIKEPKWGRFLEVNDKACEVLGYTREELLEMSTKDIEQSIPDDAAWAEHVKELQKKGSMVLEGRHRHKDGTTFPVETNVKFISEEKRSYVVAVVRDITERKRAEQRQAQLMEQLESINKELKDFAYIVSHDLKAPLRGIKTLTEWMSTDYADNLGEDGKEQMSLLSSRVDRMHNLIEGVLQYSRVGRVKEKTVPVNLNELVPEIIDAIAPPQNIAITIENELPVVECEETRIMQVFQNLLSNAVKYMDKPQGRIKIGCVEENSFWKFSVADNGPGIEEKYFEKIFQIFQTLSPRDEFESTGVGLTVIKKIVELYNGKIWVESKPGKGSTFFFTLPRQEMGAKNEKLKANTVSGG